MDHMISTPALSTASSRRGVGAQRVSIGTACSFPSERLAMPPERASGGSSRNARSSEIPDIRTIKAKLLSELGPQAEAYWQALGALCTSEIDRAEFHARIQPFVPASCIPLHNALVLSMLAEASAAPETLGRSAAMGLKAPTSPIQARTLMMYDDSGAEDAREPPVDGHASRGAKRLRHMYAGLPLQERTKLQQLQVSDQASTHTAASVWAGAGAELLEKKRKEDEKRKAVEERRRTREAKTAIGAEHWRLTAMQSSAQLELMRSRLSSTMQETLMRAVAAPICLEARELPDVHGLQDRMSLVALEAGLPGGVHLQAAAVLLAALQDHLRGILHRALAYTRQPSRPVRQERITMGDMAALLELAPHVVVEPLGQGPLERLLAPHDVSPSDSASGQASESLDGAGISWADDDAVRLTARQCTSAKVASQIVAPPPLPPDASREQTLLWRHQIQRDAVRNQVLLDQLAPLRLLDRRALTESLASGHESSSRALPISSLTAAIEQHYQAGHHHHHQHPNPMHRHKDEFFDVVDPVALLGQLCE